MQEVAILKMQKVGFTYPGTDRRVLHDVTLRCTLNSRIAVLGVRFPDSKSQNVCLSDACMCAGCRVGNVSLVNCVVSKVVFSSILVRLSYIRGA